MKKLFVVLASSACALGLGSIASPRSASTPRPAIPFDAVSVTMEVNATDLDAGVILFNDTEERLHTLRVEDPSGHVIYEMTSSDGQGLGLTEMSSETAEPDIQTALRAYPEGHYTFTGTAFDGTVLTGDAVLSHAVPDAPELTAPEDGARLGRHDARIKWDLDQRVVHYWIEIEQEDPPVDYTIQLQPGIHEFKIPADLLLSKSTYHVGIGAVGENGNVTVSEVEFDTK